MLIRPTDEGYDVKANATETKQMVKVFKVLKPLAELDTPIRGHAKVIHEALPHIIAYLKDGTTPVEAGEEAP